MQNPWLEYLRLGIVLPMVFPETARGVGPIVETADFLLRDRFFEFLEVVPVEDAARRKELRKLADAHGAGLGIACQPLIFNGRLDPGSPDPAIRAAAVAALKDAIRQAEDLGAEGIGLASGPDVPEPERPLAMEALGKSLQEICAAAANLPVHLEVFDFDVDKKRLIGPTGTAAEFARKLRKTVPNFGLMLDSSHFPLQHERMQDALSAALDVTTHIHAGNCVIGDKSHPLYGDTHPRFGIEGGESGPDELASFLEELIRTEYLHKGRRRVVTVEVKPAPGETGEELAAATEQAWRKAWEIIGNRAA